MLIKPNLLWLHRHLLYRPNLQIFTSSHEIIKDNWVNLIHTHDHCSHTADENIQCPYVLKWVFFCCSNCDSCFVFVCYSVRSLKWNLLGREFFQCERDIYYVYIYQLKLSDTLYLRFVPFDLFSFFFFLFWLIFFWAYVLPFYLACTNTCVRECAKNTFSYVLFYVTLSRRKKETARDRLVLQRSRQFFGIKCIARPVNWFRFRWTVCECKTCCYCASAYSFYYRPKVLV